MKRFFNRNTAGIVLLCLASCNNQLSLQKLSEELVYNNPPFASCHASTIVEVAPNEFLVSAFGGSHEGLNDVCIWLSKSEKASWSSPEIVADGIVNDSLRYPAWNPVLFKTSKGKLFLFYKVGPSPSKWWGMAQTSADNGLTWNTAYRLPEGILGPIKNKPVQLADGTILSPSSTEQPTAERNWKVHLEKSTDDGETWERIPIDPHTPFNVIQPSILVHPHGTLQLLCRSADQVVMQTFSEDNGTTWSALTKTALPNPNSGTDALTLKNGWNVLVYNPKIPVADDADISWEAAAKKERSKLNVALSKDGIIWKDAIILEDKESGEFSYPAIIQAEDGKIHITYTYDRVNVKHVVLDEM